MLLSMLNKTIVTQAASCACVMLVESVFNFEVIFAFNVGFNFDVVFIFKVKVYLVYMNGILLRSARIYPSPLP